MLYSPWLGSITAFLEVGAAIWILRQPTGRPELLRPLTAMLLLLAGYQILEVMICNPGLLQHQPVLSRMAFLDVTWLPPVGFYLLTQICGTHFGKGWSRWMPRFAKLSFGIAALSSFWIIVDTRFVTGTICEFMYARYTHIEPYIHFYGAWYELTQMTSIFIPAFLVARCTDVRIRQDLSDLQLGALLYIIPALFLGAVLPDRMNMALPSVMCHFAIFMAFFTLRIALRETKSQDEGPLVTDPIPVTAPS